MKKQLKTSIAGGLLLLTSFGVNAQSTTGSNTSTAFPEFLGWDNAGTSKHLDIKNDFSGKDINFSTNGSQRATILANGNVGIGVTAPTNLLDVEGGVAIGSAYSGTSTAPSNGAIIEGNVGVGTTTPDIYGIGAANFKYFTISAPTAGSNYGLLTLSGGTTGGGSINFGNQTVRQAGIITNSSSDIVFSTNSTNSSASNLSLSERLRILANGNVGIGTSAPGQKLEVTNGNILLSNTGTAAEMRFAENFVNGIHYSSFKAAASQANNINYTLPAAQGATGSYLKNDGSGGLSWDTGVMGATGSTGATGVVGTTGAVGSTGVTGATGLVGPTGTVSNAWALTGNAGTVDGTDFIGTTDAVPFNVRVNNQKSGRIDPTDKNTFWGYTAGSSNAGSNNTGVGNQALYTNSTGSGNSAYGHRALYLSTTGIENTANGAFSLNSNTTGYENSAVGYYTLYSNTTGIQNTANGTEALVSNSTGAANTGIGYRSLYQNTTGSNNTAVGDRAGNGAAANTNCTFIGANSGNTSTTSYDNSTAVGNYAGISADDQVVLGNSTIYGVYSDGGNYITSDGRFKENVTENVKGLEFINRLRPVTYNLNTQTVDNFLTQNLSDSARAARQANMDFSVSSARIRSGFIAQEVEQVALDINFNSSIISHPANEGDRYAVNYAEIVVPLVKAVQELSKQLDSMKTAMNACCQLQDTRSMQINNGTTLDGAPSLVGRVGEGASRDVQLSNKNIIVLEQNVPNPFAEQTTISYNIPTTVSRAQIVFFDLSGQIIKSVEITEKGAGQLNVFASDLSSGIYTYSLIADGVAMETKKMVKR